jgi:hypothetical protein
MPPGRVGRADGASDSQRRAMSLWCPAGDPGRDRAMRAGHSRRGPGPRPGACQPVREPAGRREPPASANPPGTTPGPGFKRAPRRVGVSVRSRPAGLAASPSRRRDSRSRPNPDKPHDPASIQEELAVSTCDRRNLWDDLNWEALAPTICGNPVAGVFPGLDLGAGHGRRGASPGARAWREGIVAGLEPGARQIEAGPWPGGTGTRRSVPKRGDPGWNAAAPARSRGRVGPSGSIGMGSVAVRPGGFRGMAAGVRREPWSTNRTLCNAEPAGILAAIPLIHPLLRRSSTGGRLASASPCGGPVLPKVPILRP